MCRTTKPVSNWLEHNQGRKSWWVLSWPESCECSLSLTFHVICLVFQALSWFYCLVSVYRSCDCWSSRKIEGMIVFLSDMALYRRVFFGAKAMKADKMSWKVWRDFSEHASELWLPLYRFVAWFLYHFAHLRHIFVIDAVVVLAGSYCVVVLVVSMRGHVATFTEVRGVCINNFYCWAFSAFLLFLNW